MFKSSGIEIESEEVDFIKHKDILYISKGEDFDENSQYAEYEIIRELGHGGFGKVCEAKHYLTGERVAIKIYE